MSALVKTIKSRLTDDTIYPVTKADAVYMGSSTVTTVEGQINDLKDIVGDSSIGESNTITSLIGASTMGTTATTITGAIAEHEQKLTSLFKTKNYAYTYTCPASGAVNVTGGNMGLSDPTGYTPVGIVAYTTNSNEVFPRSMIVNASSGSSFCVLTNKSTSAVTQQISAWILYIRRDAVK